MVQTMESKGGAMGIADWSEQEREDVLRWYGIDDIEPDQWTQPAVGEDEDEGDGVDLTAAQMMAADDSLARMQVYLQDTSDPLGINDAAYLQQLRLKEGSSDERSLSICSAAFHPRHFLRSVHRDTSFADLVRGTVSLQEACGQRGDRLKELVKSNFGRFINAKNAVDLVYRQMQAGGLTTDGDRMDGGDRVDGLAGSGAAVEEAFQRAQEAFHPLLSRRGQEERLRQRLQVFEKYSFILSLGGKFERYLQLGDYQQASYDYRKGRALLAEVDPESGFGRVLGRTWAGHLSSVLGRLRAALYQKLASPIYSHDVHAKLIEYLLELDASPDPATFYLEQSRGHLLDQIRLCRQKCIDEISAGGQVSKDPGRLLELCRARDSRAIVESGWARKWRSRAAFLANLAQAFHAFAHPFSKFTTALFAGKLHPVSTDGGDQMAVYVAKLCDFAQTMADEIIDALKTILVDDEGEWGVVGCPFLPACIHALGGMVETAEAADMSDVMVEQVKRAAQLGTSMLVGAVWEGAGRDVSRLPAAIGNRSRDSPSILVDSFEAIISLLPSPNDPSNDMSTLLLRFIDAMKQSALFQHDDDDPMEMGLGYRLLHILANLLHMQRHTLPLLTHGMDEDPAVGLRIQETLDLAYYHVSELYLARRLGPLIAAIQDSFDSFPWDTALPTLPTICPLSVRPHTHRLLAELVIIQNEILDVSQHILRPLIQSLLHSIFKEFLAGIMRLGTVSPPAYAQARLDLSLLHATLITAVAGETEELFRELIRLLREAVDDHDNLDNLDELDGLVEESLLLAQSQTALQYACFTYT